MALGVRGSVALHCFVGRDQALVELALFDVFHDDPNMSNNYKCGWRRRSGATTGRGEWEAGIVSPSQHVWVNLGGDFGALFQ